MESQLASWNPRRPSPRLKAELFRAGAEAVALEGRAVLWRGGRWLAPALACSFVALIALSPRNQRLAGLTVSDTNSFLNYAAYLMAGHSQQNGPERKTLERTFASRAPAKVGSLAAVATNYLLH